MLQVRNITQTSVTLEWAPLKLATAKLRSLDIYRNGERLSSIPSPLTNTSTKHSGMELNTEYTFQLIMRTTAGTYPSNLLRMRTHTMHDTSGISVCFGTVQDPALLNEAKQALTEMGAKWSDKIQIDTSHFVCTTAAATPAGASTAGNLANAPGVMYQRALQLSIPIVQPHWVLACRAEKRCVSLLHVFAFVEYGAEWCRSHSSTLEPILRRRRSRSKDRNRCPRPLSRKQLVPRQPAVVVEILPHLSEHLCPLQLEVRLPLLHHPVRHLHSSTSLRQVLRLFGRNPSFRLWKRVQKMRPTPRQSVWTGHQRLLLLPFQLRKQALKASGRVEGR